MIRPTILLCLLLCACGVHDVTAFDAQAFPSGYICKLLDGQERVLNEDEEMRLEAEMQARGQECAGPVVNTGSELFG